MFVITGDGTIGRSSGRPANCEALQQDDFHFIPGHRAWDTDEREWVARAMGL